MKMQQVWRLLIGVLCALWVFHAHATTVVVKPGDTLEELFGKEWKAACAVNNLTNCNSIRVGQVLTVPEKVSALSVVSHIASRKECVTLGVSPFNPSLDKERMRKGIAVLPISQAMKEELIQKVFFEEVAEYNMVLPDNARYDMVFGSGKQPKLLRDVRLCTAEEGAQQELGLVIQLSDGTEIAVPYKCGNIAVMRRVKPIVIPPPVVVTEVAPEVLIVPEVQMPIAEEKEEESSHCPLDLKSVLGQEYEPEHDGGNKSHSTFLSSAVYCTWRGKTGTHGVGIGMQASWWEGLVNQGLGKYSGGLLAIGPAYEYIADQGWDVEMKWLFGSLEEKFKQGDYKSHREFGVTGPSVAYNNYQRRMAGKKLLAETQLFGVLLFPFSTDAEHSWQGQPIEDTKDLSQLDSYLNLGVRQYLYSGQWFELYTQLGYFLEKPAAESGSFRIGLTDANRIMGVGIGFDKDFKSGNKVQAWGWWIDIMRGFELVRKNHRSGQVENLHHGIIMVPTL
ncbi:MAG: LysM peptidoglycan-binding domain-containing protein [Minisyncoccota bacterium]